ncbi:MAG: 7-carboxy-7-deazaguanine synthase [Pirellulaceae bacterium]|jgi:7-carboxy-7-deazaguanine synthase
MRIAEIYNSIQGEGLLTGTPSVFVRASGCNLRCWYCDTPYASWNPEGEDLSVEEILSQVSQFDCQHVVLTGGEPMLFAEMLPLCESLYSEKKHITIETAGTLFLPLRCDLMSISPKMSNSTPSLEKAPNWTRRHERTRHAPDVIRKLIQRHEYQFKFVIDELKDCEEVDSYLEEMDEIVRERVMLMPQAIDADQLADVTAWLEPYCNERGLTFCSRKQLEWYGLARGT